MYKIYFQSSQFEDPEYTFEVICNDRKHCKNWLHKYIRCYKNIQSYTSDSGITYVGFECLLKNECLKMFEKISGVGIKKFNY